jgi:outer membrane protein assembly factor BamE (lipoprotein component of BamABCDE complex)
MIKTIFLIAMFGTTMPAAWTNQTAWPRIRQGMTEQQVVSLLGEPIENESSSVWSIWYYQERPTKSGDTVLERPRFGKVIFKADDLKQLLVTKVIEPDWSKPLPEKTLNKPKTEVRPAVSPLVIQQPEKNPQKTEAPKVNPITHQATPQQPSPQRSQEQVKPKQSLQDVGSKYFIYGGALILIMALVIAIAQGTRFFR